jgi:tetratricopeptide (TPR) repeat protein
MSNAPNVDLQRQRAQEALRQLRGLCSDDDVDAAKRLVLELRDVREYTLMGQLAEAVSRHHPKDAKNRRLYGQYLIETGKATAAIDMLRPLAQRLPKDHAEFAEASGLLGRAYKQIFFDAGDKTSDSAREALKQAIAAYRKPYEQDPANTWHGVNLVALVTRARRLGLRFASDLKVEDVARKVTVALKALPQGKRDPYWYFPTLAEASLGLGDWAAVEQTIRAYAAAKDAKAFQVASTLRQFTEVWDLEAVDDRGRGIVAILRARLMELPGGTLELSAGDLQRVRAQPEPEQGQLEAVLGKQGPETFRWWKIGLERALSVAAVRQRLGRRFGTGFLVRAGEFGLEPADELLVMTNFHVVNNYGATRALKPEEAEIVFEAVDAERTYLVEKILWSSPVDRHDVSLLRMKTPITAIRPLSTATELPILDDNATVYVIGHPGGRDLAFSFQDNKLLDHEGPPAGKPQIPNVCRVHYHAPTEGGSSGSPVFNAKLWEVIALHHRGKQFGIPMLNGKEGIYGANEGISAESIRRAIATTLVKAS